MASTKKTETKTETETPKKAAPKSVEGRLAALEELCQLRLHPVSAEERRKLEERNARRKKVK